MLKYMTVVTLVYLLASQKRSPKPEKIDEETRTHHINAMLEEYKSLRTESLNSINNRITIFLSSFTSLTIVTSATVVARIPDTIVIIVLAAAVPTLAKTLASGWLGEYRRSQRAGAAIAALEESINAAIGRQSLTWENSLRAKKLKITVSHLYSIGVLLCLAYLSEALALYYIYRDSYNILRLLGLQELGVVRLILCAFTALVLIEVMSLLLLRSEWREARKAAQ